MAYRLFAHTADIGIEAHGGDLGEALAEAARGLTEVVTGHPPPPRGDREVTFTVEAPDEGAAVVAFLSELLWLLESEEALWCQGGATVREGALWRVEAAANVTDYDPARHGRGVEVKAVTYHDLSVERTDGGCRIRVILDI